MSIGKSLRALMNLLPRRRRSWRARAAMIARIEALESMALSVKYFGYELARATADALPVREGLAPMHVGLTSKPSTQADLSSDWVAYWCGQLKIGVAFHRKVWELCYALQAMQEAGVLREGARGLGFGCGEEALPSYLASRGVRVTVTDQPPENRWRQGWAKTRQHAASLDSVFHAHLVERATFDRNVALRHVDMNAIPRDLVDYDCCWSICAFEHLGSIEKGLDFVVNAMDTLKSGGLAVHTTEFNFASDAETVDHAPTVLFLRRHFEALARRLTALGHEVAPLGFDIGDRPLDKFIDVPPYVPFYNRTLKDSWGMDAPHIKTCVHGFPSTCYGLIVRKAG